MSKKQIRSPPKLAFFYVFSPSFSFLLSYHTLTSPFPSSSSYLQDSGNIIDRDVQCCCERGDRFGEMLNSIGLKIMSKCHSPPSSLISGMTSARLTSQSLKILSSQTGLTPALFYCEEEGDFTITQMIIKYSPGFSANWGIQLVKNNYN